MTTSNQQDTGTTAAVAVVESDKPSRGWSTTEFLTIALTIIGVASTTIPPQYANASVVLAGVYAVCRTILKIVHSLGMAAAIADLPEIPPQKGTQ